MADPAEWKPTDYAAKLIKWKAKQLVGKYGFTDADRDDIEQELLLHLWRRLSQYTPGRGHPDAFAKAIVTNAALSLGERQRAIKRGGGRRELSLNDNDEVGRDEKRTIERGDLLDQDAALRRLGRAQRSFVDEADLRMTVEEFLSKLPPKLRALAEKLLEDLPTHVAEEAGIPWGTLFDRISKMRKLATDADLQEFAPRLRRSSADSGT
jgi:RNA polymerase sigma-70 factor (ECF subfamily)